jgi:Fe-S oxidoreductase
MGNWSIMQREMRNLVERYTRLKVDRVIFAHDDCYTHMKLAAQMGIEIPFKVLHLFDYLLSYLQNHKGEIRPLNKSIAYQRPCASRYTVEKEEVLDQIFQLIGVQRVQRAFDRSNALCCGQNLGGILPARQNMEPYQDINVADAKDHGATAMVFLCPMCLTALRSKCLENGLEPLFIVDLCRMALAEMNESESM